MIGESYTLGDINEMFLRVERIKRGVPGYAEALTLDLMADLDAALGGSDGVAEWMETPSPHLFGAVPRDVLVAGRADNMLEAVRAGRS